MSSDLVERMNRTLKETTVQRYHYESHDQLRRHLADFLAAYNFAKRLKTLSGLSPHEYVCKIWTEDPQPLQNRPDPPHLGTMRRNCLTRFTHRGDFSGGKGRGGEGVVERRNADQDANEETGERTPSSAPSLICSYTNDVYMVVLLSVNRLLLSNRHFVPY